MSKFATTTKSQFEDLRKKFEEKREGAKKPVVEEKKFDYKFQPELIKGEARSVYVVRILPHVAVNDGVDEPWVHNRVHIFKPKGTDKNTYQVCPSTHDEKAKCPICEHSKMWFAKGDKTSEDIGRTFWKKKRWHVNVYVKSDPRKGESNQTGKVLVWEFGPKVMDKLSEALSMHKMFFWDVEEGYDFNLVVKLVGGFNNFDSSDFSREKSRLVEDDEALDAIHAKIYDLKKTILEQKVRPYEELKAILEGRKLDEAKAGSSATATRDSNTPRQVERAVEPDVTAVDVGEPPKPTPKPKPVGKPAEAEIDIDKINFDDEPPF
jgi:hypothetical protein